MLKYILLAGVMAVSSAVTAQQAPVSNGPAAPMESQSGSTVSPPVQDGAATMPMAEQKPMSTQAVPASGAQIAQAAPADPAVPTPASKAEQVAAVVNGEFSSYDADKNGSLNATEFASWMVALKTASDPATKADSAEVKTWVKGAFASADTDKSKSVSKDELSGFLSKA